MMTKPNGWDEAAAVEGGAQKAVLPSGNYICTILKAEAVKNKNGGEQLLLNFDIAEGEHANFFRQQYNDRKDAGIQARWGGRIYQNTTGNSVKFYKGMMKAIENSNHGYKWNFDETTLTGKKFLGQFRREEFYDSTGEKRWTTKCKYVRTIGTECEVLEDKPLDDGGVFPMQNSSNTFTEISVEELSEDTLPF